jgi:hypothetical protein
MRVQQNGKHFSSALVAALLLATAGTLAAQECGTTLCREQISRNTTRISA